MNLRSERSGAAVLGETTIPQLLRRRAASSPDSPARWSHDAQGRWQSSGWPSFAQSAAALAQGLRALGLARGARVGIMAASSATWDDCSMAVLAVGGVVVGIDAHAGAGQLAAISRSVPLDALVVDSSEQIARFGANRPALCLLTGVPQPDAAGGGAVHLSLAQVQEAGRRQPAQEWDQSRPDDPALVVFTSGTTGVPKGIVYSHAQVCTAVQAIVAAFDDIGSGSRLVCWLPLSNLFQRMINLCAIERDAQIFYVGDPREVMRHLPAIRPTIFIGVPRFFEKFHQTALAQLRQAPGWRGRLAAWAVDTASHHADRVSAGEAPGLTQRLQAWLADQLVLRRVRAALGGRLRYLISGSAPMPMVLLRGMQALGLPVLEAYGLSECVVPVCLNRWSAWRPGTVGRPPQGVELRLSEEGELLVRSAGVFGGYLGEAGMPAALRPEGWLATGDLAEIDADGFVRLIGRKSELFKLSTGRAVAPAQIEALLAGIDGVEHLAVFGPGRKALLLVVCLATEAQADAVLAGLRARIAADTTTLPAYLRPVAAVLTRQPFSIDRGELTANLKLRRAQVGQRYGPALDAAQSLVDSVDAPASGRLAFGSDGETVELVRLWT